MGFFKSLFTDLLWDKAEEGPEFDGPEETQDLAPQELKDAEARVPYSKFVQSCRRFYTKRGFLSAKQRAVLTLAGTPHRRERQFGYWSDYKNESYYDAQGDFHGSGDYNEDADE